MAAAATIVASRTLRVHMCASSLQSISSHSGFRAASAPPVESVTRVGLDRPLTSEKPYLPLPAPAPPEEPAEPDEPAEPEEPLAPDEPLEPEEPLVPEEPDEPDAAPPASLPDVLPLPEQPFCLYCGSVGVNCWQSVPPPPFLLFDTCEDEEPEVPSFVATFELLPVLDVLPELEPLCFDLLVLLMPVVELPPLIVSLLLDEPLVPLRPDEEVPVPPLLVPAPLPYDEPVLPELDVPLEPELFRLPEVEPDEPEVPDVPLEPVEPLP